MYKDRNDYIRRLFGAETDERRALREAGDIAIEPEDSRFLQLLIRLGNIRSIVEIGTLHGYSALCMAEALPEGGVLHTIEKDEKRAEVAAQNLKNPKIRMHRGDALNVLPQLEKEAPFDMVFIDADKLHYCDYLDWAEKNVRKGGLIAGDNTFLSDAVWSDAPIPRVRETARQAMRDFNRRLADPEKYAGILLPTAAGMTVAVKLF